MVDDRVDDLLRLDLRALENLAGVHLGVGFDLRCLGAHELLVVVRAAGDPLRVLEGCLDLLVRVGGDPLRVGDRLIVEHEELLLGVVLPAGEGLLELQDARVHLAHLALSLGPLLGGFTCDDRAQRRSALLGLGADGLRLPLGLCDLLRGVGLLPLEARLVCGVLGVDLQADLVGIVLGLLPDAGDLSVELCAPARLLIARRREQTLGLDRRVLDDRIRLLFGDPQDGLEALP